MVLADAIDQIARYGWAITCGVGALMFAGRGLRGLWRVGRKVQFIYEQMQPNSGTTLFDKVSSHELALHNIQQQLEAIIVEKHK